MFNSGYYCTHKSLYLLAVISLLILFSGCATTLKNQTSGEEKNAKSFSKKMDQLFNDPRFGDAFWGVEIQSAKTGEILYSRNADKNLQPASNLKLFTTAAALHYFGPDYRYHTDVYGNGNIGSDGVMNSDLVIKGSGDPSFSGSYTRGSTTSIALLKIWIDDLKRRGVKRISGDIIGDDSIFNNRPLPWSWMWGYAVSGFSAEQSGLCFNDNVYDLYVVPGKKTSDPAKYWLALPTDFLLIKNMALTGTDSSKSTIDINRAFNTNQITISGEIPLGANTTHYWGSVHNPPLYFSTVFYEQLRQNGIEVGGFPHTISELSPVRTNTLYRNNSDRLMSYESRPLSTIIRITNKYSQNFYAEQLNHTLGKLVGGEGTTAKGTEVVETFLQTFGINPNDFSMVDGCGLSHMNMVKPSQITKLLRYMYSHKYAKTYIDSLPLAGVDGTISHRMKNSSANGKVHAKTGFIGHVRCLSGYVDIKNGDTLVFSMMCNNYLASTREAENIQDEACILMADYSK